MIYQCLFVNKLKSFAVLIFTFGVSYPKNWFNSFRVSQNRLLISNIWLKLCIFRMLTHFFPGPPACRLYLFWYQTLQYSKLPPPALQAITAQLYYYTAACQLQFHQFQAPPHHDFSRKLPVSKYWNRPLHTTKINKAMNWHWTWAIVSVNWNWTMKIVQDLQNH